MTKDQEVDVAERRDNEENNHFVGSNNLKDGIEKLCVKLGANFAKSLSTFGPMFLGASIARNHFPTMKDDF